MLTVSEVEEIAKKFIEANPEKAENVVGIAFDKSLTAGTSEGTNTINAICYANGAYPKVWYKDNGKLIYGSTTDEMKKSLGIVRDWYKAGIIDPQLGTRTWDDITALGGTIDVVGIRE